LEARLVLTDLKEKLIGKKFVLPHFKKLKDKNYH